MKVRKNWISTQGSLPVSTQCALAGVNRSSCYGQLKTPLPSAEDLLLKQLIDEEYTRHPFYGTRRMKRVLLALGYQVNRKRVQRLMRELGLAGMAPGPNTSKPHPEHKVYPYLLRGLAITRPNHVWSTDVTYCRLPGGFMYLTAVIDWYSRKVLAWRLSNSLDSSFCIDGLEDAIRRYGKPEIFNSDQGCQYTSKAFTGVLKGHDVRISMDGRGRALDNSFVERLWRSIKHEDLCLKGYATPMEMKRGLAEYFRFYNSERIHQALGRPLMRCMKALQAAAHASLTSTLKRRSPTRCRRLQRSNRQLHEQPAGYHLKFSLFSSTAWGPLQSERIYVIIFLSLIEAL
jgi:putative transposase